jgi:glycosyltransferase involved in cell wall biosynthesis
MSLCMIVAPQNTHWVLDRIAKEVGSRYGGEVSYCYDLNAIPKADSYFVTHYSLLTKVFATVNPAFHKVTCLFTHESVPLHVMKDVMNLCHRVVCENQVETQHLKDAGINPNLLSMVVECSDPVLFRPHSRTGKGAVLVSSAYYPRKNPKLLREVIEACVDLDFIVVGKNWPKENFPLNVTYHEDVPYESYPEIYGKCDVFLSCAKLEGGGPGGLIEAMHSNIFPVVSDTGNAREYIVDGYNGHIFPIDATATQISELIRKAYKADIQESLPYNDIWQTVQHYNWDAYASQMKDIINGTDDYTDCETQPN